MEFRDGSRRTGHYLKAACSDDCAARITSDRVSRWSKRLASGQLTKIEKTLLRLVRGAYPDAVARYRVGQYEVDVFVPSLNMAFEADGERWHTMPGAAEKDARRDADMLLTGIHTVRFTEKELRDIGKRLSHTP